MWWTSIAVFLSKRTPPGSARTPGRIRAPELAAQEGLTLIEVIISAMLVALIAVGTLTGFAAAGKTTAEAGTHAQATVCAQQDEERLRGMNSEALANLGSQTSTVAENCQCLESVSGAWRYCPSSNLAGESYKGTVFTLSTSVTPHTESESGAKETCTVENGTISYLRTTTQVKWSGLGERHAVSQSSIVTTPLAAALEVKVETENLEPVEGAEVTLTSNGTNFTQTTGSFGCVIFGYVNSNSVEVKVQKTGLVEKDGNASPITKTVSISGDTMNTTAFIVNQGGAITAGFESKGAAVNGDTFVASHTSMGTTSSFDQEGTLGSYTTKVTSPSTLYPFVTVGKPAGKSEYLVYAGDCEANNPETVTSKAVAAAKAQVEPGGSASVKVTVPPIKIEVWSGTSSSHGSLINGKASLTNKSCEKATPNNYLVSGTTIPSKWVHSQNIVGGKLERENQPFGTFELCVTNGTEKYTTTVTNNSANGPTVPVPTIYMKSVGSSGSTCP